MGNPQSYPRILTKEPHGNPVFLAEGKAGDDYFQVSVTFDAAATVPERFQTIKEALLARAQAITRQIDESGSFDWASEGFRRHHASNDISGQPVFWERVYSLDDIWDVL